MRITRLQNPYIRCSETAKGYRLGQSAGSLDTPTHSGLLWEGRVKFLMRGPLPTSRSCVMLAYVSSGSLIRREMRVKIFRSATRSRRSHPWTDPH